jgi:hypothetical protein
LRQRARNLRRLHSYDLGRRLGLRGLWRLARKELLERSRLYGLARRGLLLLPHLLADVRDHARDDADDEQNHPYESR